MHFFMQFPTPVCYFGPALFVFVFLAVFSFSHHYHIIASEFACGEVQGMKRFLFFDMKVMGDTW